MPMSLNGIAHMTGAGAGFGAAGVATFYSTGVHVSTPKYSSSTPKYSSSSAGPSPPPTPSRRGEHHSLPSVAPVMSRSVSHVGTNVESYRQTIAEIISQIRKYDPYPCILGIPVMPALFTSCKFYIFICFVLIGTRSMISCFRQL
eukprot:gene19179-19552_t